MTKRVLAAALVGLLTVPFPVLAQQSDRAGVVTVLEGNVTAHRQPQTVALKFRDEVRLRDRIVTEEKSLARMLLGGRAVVTVRERSSLTITDIPPSSTLISADAGTKFGLAVAREHMAQDRIDIRTPNAVAGVRGTVVISEVIPPPQSGGPVTTKFYVLRGTVTVQQINPPGPPITVNPMQEATVSGNNPPTTAPIPPERVAGIVAGLQPASLRGGDAFGQDVIKTQAVNSAVALMSVLNAPETLLNPTVMAPTTTNQTFAPLTPFSGTTELPPEFFAPAPACPGCIRFSGVTRSITGEPFASFSGSLVSTSPLELVGFDTSIFTHSGSNSFFDVTSGTSMTLAGPLVNLIDTTIITSGAFLEIVNGRITSTAPLITLDPSHIRADDSIVILRGGALTLSDSLVTLLDSTLTSDAHGLDVFNGGVITKTGASPLIDLVGTGTVAGGAQLNVTDSMVSIEATPGTRNVMTLEGSLIRSVNGTLTGGNGLDILEGAILTKAPSTDTAPLFDLTNSTFTSGDALVNVWFSPSSATPSTLLLGEAPLLKATNSTISLQNNLLYVETGVASSTGAAPLVDLTNSVISVSDLGAFEFIIGSTVSLAGPLFAMNGGQLATGAEFLVMAGSTLTSTGTSALIQMTNGAVGSVAAGLADIVEASQASLAGPLLWMSGGSQLSVLSGLVAASGSTVTGSSTSALFMLDNAALSSSAALLQADGHNAKIALNGPVLSAANGSTVSVTNSSFELMSAFGGGMIDITTQSGPIVSFSGGSTLSTPRLIYGDTHGAINTNGSTGALFSFAGGSHTLSTSGSTALQLVGFNLDSPGELVPEIDNGDGFDNNVNFPAASDQPLQHGGAGIDAEGATLTTSTGLLLDKALLQASAPLINLKSGSTMNVNGNGIDMVNQAKLVSLIGPLIRLDASTLNISGHAVNLAGGSFLKVTSGDLISVNNGSTLTVGGHLLNLAGGSLVQINNGTVLTVNNSTVTINGAFVNFGTGIQTTLSVSNSLTPAGSCGNCGPLPIAFTNGALQSNVNVSGSAIQGNNSGFAGTAGTGTGSVILMNGPSATLTINGN